jgi:hypothetical protein
MVIPLYQQTSSGVSFMGGGGGVGGKVRQRCTLVRLALQRHCTENWKQIFPGKKLRGLVPNSYIHVSGSDLYIPSSKIGGPIVGIYKSREVHECGNWEQGRAVSFLGTHKSDLVCSAGSQKKMDRICQR